MHTIVMPIIILLVIQAALAFLFKRGMVVIPICEDE